MATMVVIAAMVMSTLVVTADEAPALEIAQGRIAGTTEFSTNGRRIYSYYSIPYAEPPIGKLRLKVSVVCSLRPDEHDYGT